MIHKETTQKRCPGHVKCLGMAVLIGMLVVGAGCNDDPPPPPDNPWEPCECEEPEFTLTVGGAGVDPDRITVDPDRALYTKGELVSITYDIPADTRLAYWWVSPNSHLAHYAHDTTIYLYMAEDTVAYASVRSNMAQVLVANDNVNAGTVEDVGTGWFVYGSNVTLSATPNDGYEVDYWKAANNRGTQWRSNEITVKAEGENLYTVYWRQTDDDCSYTFHTGEVSVSGDGEAEVFTAASDHLSHLAPFAHSSSKTTYYFNAHCRPDPGYDLVYWHWTPPNDNVPRYFVGTPRTDPTSRYMLGRKSLSSLGSTTFEAHLTKTVSLDVEINGQGVVTSPSFKVAWNPQRYEVGTHVGAEPEKLVYANAVTMTADPCDGWGFSHWEIKDAGGEWQYAGGNEQLTVFMNWWGEDSLFHIPPNEEMHYVKAVFRDPCIDDNCSDNCSFLFFSTEGDNKTVPICKFGPATPLPSDPHDPDISGVYNCIAWSVGRTDKWIQGTWPQADYDAVKHWLLAVDIEYGDGDGVCTLDEWDAFFDAHGFERIIEEPVEGESEPFSADIGFISGDHNLHGYNMWSCDAIWSSKLGASILVSHGDTWLVRIAPYGEPVHYYKRK